VSFIKEPQHFTADVALRLAAEQPQRPLTRHASFRITSAIRPFAFVAHGSGNAPGTETAA